MKKLTITFLLLIFVLMGCASQNGMQKNPTGQQISEGTLSNVESIWSTVPMPSTIVIYNHGKSKSVQANNPSYSALAQEIEALLKNSDLSKADMYKLGLPQNGDISKYRNVSGVELIFNSPFELTLSTGKKAVYRLFAYCKEKPMLFIGTKATDDYYGSGLGPVVISDTSNLTKIIVSLIN